MAYIQATPCMMYKVALVMKQSTVTKKVPENHNVHSIP